MEIRTVGDCFYQIRNGANIKQGSVSGGYPITRIETTANDKFNRDRMGYAGITDLSKYESYVLEDGDLLMSHINSVQYLGRTVLYEKAEGETVIHGMNLLGLKANRDIINPAYARYFFYSHYFREQLGRITKKSVNQASFTVADLKKIRILTPSLDQQAEIVDSLDRVKKLISKRNDELIMLDELIKARFVEMFGDCRINPKGWNTVALGDISMVGSSKRVFVEDLKESGIPFYRGTEVGALAEGKSITPELFITEEYYNTLVDATGKPEIGDLLMPSICPDGRIWVVNTEEPFYFKDGRVLWVHDIDEKYDPVFLLYTLKDRIMTDYGSIASGTTFAELKIFALKQCQVFDVPMEEQKRFAAFINQVDKSKIAIQKSLDETQMLFDSLMQQYFG